MGTEKTRLAVEDMNISFGHMTKLQRNLDTTKIAIYLTCFPPKNVLQWPPSFLKMSVNAQLGALEWKIPLYDDMNTTKGGVHMGATFLASTVNTTPFEGTKPPLFTLHPAVFLSAKANSVQYEKKREEREHKGEEGKERYMWEKYRTYR